jgi:uncharacterized protein YycO
MKALDFTKIIKDLNNTIYKKYLNRPYPTTKGYILVTPDAYKGIVPLGHSALVWDKNKVIEATTKGVVLGPNNWKLTKKKVFGLKVKNLSNANMSKAANYAYKFLKKPYNYTFNDTKTRTKLYCSQLIWAAYLDLFNINLDTSFLGQANKTNKGMIHPVELINSKNTETIYYHAK